MPFSIRMTKQYMSKARFVNRTGIYTAVLVACFAIIGHASAQTPQSLPESPLIVETQAGSHHFVIQLANTTKERNMGLMFRKEMAADHGMLFDMGTPQQASFWMKNTSLPLDIIFIRTDGHIANIEQGIPFQLSPPIRSKGRVLGVLELNAGTARSLGIKPGDMVRHPIFNNWTDVQTTDP